MVLGGDFLAILNQIGAFGTVLMGCLGLFAPRAASNLVGLEAVTAPGRSEFRATYGGFWLPLGLAPLLTGADLAYQIAGLCWAGAALGRVASIAVDRVGTPQNWGAVGFEAMFAAALLVGSPFWALLA